MSQATITNADELLAYCPGCGTLETLWFTDKGLITTRKFSTSKGFIYHNCGTTEPCLLLRALQDNAHD